MRGLVAIAIASLVAAVTAPANALTGPMPGSQFKNIGSENVERVVVVRRSGYVARGPCGNVAVGRTTVVRPGAPSQLSSWRRRLHEGGAGQSTAKAKSGSGRS